MLRLFLIFIIYNYFDLSFTDSTGSYSYTMPDYSFEWTQKANLRDSLSKKFALKKQSEARLHKLKERIADDTEYYDNIPHFKISVSEKVKKNSNRFENAFKNIIGMVGITYSYKRDLYWRTWREVTYPNSSKEVVCYKCQNTINYTENNCTDCHRGGYWAIEDKPPSCSFEIFSTTGKNQLCIGNFWELKKGNFTSCPTTATFQELSQCNNPIITKVRVSPDYSITVSERASTVICQGREMCEFSTYYKIDSGMIIFRIINSSNDVIYSRIMKPDGENFACTEDCGHFDFETTILTRKENHVILNLLKDYSRKRKRENSLTVYKKGKNISNESKNTLQKSLFHKMHKYIIEQPFSTEKYPPIKTTLSFCNRMVLREVDRDYEYDGA
ncbi:uncharacterized protein [Choristoneura fumiferana]|uniref:uncharacterized protein n=1 Tax=Choristoneura fumiferana TaxID=7141 RepID=UPI003D15D4F0